MNTSGQVRRADVTSAWSGIRPLAIDPKAKDTASALRDHIVVKDDDGLVTITGSFMYIGSVCIASQVVSVPDQSWHWRRFASARFHSQHSLLLASLFSLTILIM